jgi:hypothetical protein
VDGFGGSNILMTRIFVLFVIVVVAILSLCIIVGPCGVVSGDLLGVDVLEEASILHGVIGFGMKLAGTLQGLVVVILVIMATTWLLIECDLVLRVLLTIVLPELFELEVLWPYNLSEMRSELF